MLLSCGNQAPVAQLVEQGPFKPKVVGSNPARRTMIKISVSAGVFIILLRAANHKCGLRGVRTAGAMCGEHDAPRGPDPNPERLQAREVRANPARRTNIKI